ncbi:hypothetical protein SAMN06273572_102577 [Monaibacterium marinum]|uniref:Nucleotidyltransferase n=1 Tax=Pontivivens marinum TaxID=1690039 RepID=A0A2C9CRR0_9RHOB|nr:GSU2403 family nucleotidyltransferase fold protein [Monaibacterium marinum]SOH93898.1 hypothetical protein SAMN06273572_102577 [Monaibacterium marinum]
MAINPLSAVAQAAWIDLNRLLGDAALSDLRGKATCKRVGAKQYWYDRYRIGAQVTDRYLGEDTEELRDRIARAGALRDAQDGARRERVRLVRLLRAEGMVMPDLATGQIISAMARAGVFRLGGTVVGTQAFRLYEGLLGVRMGLDQAVATDDIDIASFERLSLALGDRADPDLQQVFAELKFDPQPSLQPGAVWRWRQSTRGTLVEFLTPSFEADEGVRPLPALGVSAQALHFLNYLIAEPVRVPVAYRDGAQVQVPQPARFAIHKLIVAHRRFGGEAPFKARKDRAQARFLIKVLVQEDPDALYDALDEAREKGPAWRGAIAASLRRIPDTAAILAG